MALSGIIGGASVGAGISIVIQAIDKFSKPLKQAQDGIKETGKSTGKLTNFFKVNQIAVMAAAGAIVGFGVSAVKSAIDAEGAFQSFNMMVGDTADTLMNEMHIASKGMISDFELVSNANKALALGIQQSDIPALLEVATARAKIFGSTATKAFEDLTLGIGRGSKLILDNLGIILDMDKVYSEYAVTIGKTSEELSEMEKKQAMVNAIIEESSGLVKAQNFLLDTHAEQLSRVSANWKNFKQDVGNALLDVYDWISGAKLVNETFKAQVDAMVGVSGAYEDIAKDVMTLDRIQKELVDNYKSSIDAEEKLNETLNETREAYNKTSAEIESAGKELEASFRDSEKAASDLLDTLLNLSDVTFAGERAKTLEIAQQKEIIRQLELRELAGEDVGDILDAEKKKLQKLRLEQDKYDNDRAIQAAENAIQLEETGRLQSINFEDLVRYEQDKFVMLKEEEQKQKNIQLQLQDNQREQDNLYEQFMSDEADILGKIEEEHTARNKIEDDIKRTNDMLNEYMDIFTAVSLGVSLAQEQEIANNETILDQMQQKIDLYKQQAEEIGYVPLTQEPGESNVEFASKVTKHIDDTLGDVGDDITDELKKTLTPSAIYEASKLAGVVPGINKIPIIEPKEEPTTVVGKILRTIGKFIGIGPLSLFQEGGPVLETGPAIVHKGEYVIPKKDVGKGGGLYITITGNNYGTDADDIAFALAKKIGAQIRI